MRHFLLAGLGFVAVTAAAKPARASCHLAEVVEVFGGTAACPQAQYVVIQATAGGQDQWSGNPININGAAFGTVGGGIGALADNTKLVVGTAAAQSLFGITFDGVATGTLPLATGTVVHVCSSASVTYGAGAVPALQLGQAIRQNLANGNWTLVSPAPTNRTGAVGAPTGTCPAAPDAGPDSATDAATDAATDSATQDAAADTKTDAATDAGADTKTDATASDTATAADTKTAADTSTSPTDTGSTTPTDTGSTTPPTDTGSAATDTGTDAAVAPAEDDGCGCRTAGSTQSSAGAFAFLALAIAAIRRRR